MYQRVLKDDPDNPDVLHMLGVAALQQNDLENAAGLISKALALKPDFSLAHNSIGSVYQRLGRVDDAIRSFRQAIKFDPENGNAQFNLGTMLLALRKHNEGAQALAQAANLLPSFPDAHYQLGVAYRSLRLFDQAIAAFSRAIEINPDFSLAYSGLGNVYGDMGKLQEADAAHRRAIEADPGFHIGYFNLGNIAVRLDQTERAVEAYRRVLEIKPDFVEAHGNLADTLFKAGEHEDAVAAIREGIARHPDEANLYYMLGSAFQEMGNLDDALKTADAALESAPYNTKIISLKVAVLTALGQKQAADTLFDPDRLIDTVRLKQVQGFEDLGTFNAELRDHIQRHPTLFDDPTHNATRNGKHTGELLQEPKGPMAALEELIMQAAEAYRRKIGTDPNHPFAAAPPRRFRLTAWAVVLSAEGYQTAHIHPEAWLSGVYYAQVPAVVEAETPAHAGWIAFAKTPELLEVEPGPEVRLIQPKEGLMVLFPSYFFHNTIPFETDETRISIAFDLIPVWG